MSDQLPDHVVRVRHAALTWLNRPDVSDEDLGPWLARLRKRVAHWWQHGDLSQDPLTAAEFDRTCCLYLDSVGVPDLDDDDEPIVVRPEEGEEPQ